MSEKDYLFCPECGKHYLSGSGKYCPHDGKPLVLMGNASFTGPIVNKLSPPSPHQKLQQEFMRSGIFYFEQGGRLFHLVYFVLVIQVAIAIFGFIVACLLPLFGIGILSSILNSINQAIRNTPR